ncbi:UNVERIFIED_CONTAM: hypothetical protein HDU68_010787, partial [Siphonaria sp. JEL0065]
MEPCAKPWEINAVYNVSFATVSYQGSNWQNPEPLLASQNKKPPSVDNENWIDNGNCTTIIQPESQPGLEVPASGCATPWDMTKRYTEPTTVSYNGENWANKGPVKVGEAPSVVNWIPMGVCPSTSLEK